MARLLLLQCSILYHIIQGTNNIGERDFQHCQGWKDPQAYIKYISYKVWTPSLMVSEDWSLRHDMGHMNREALPLYKQIPRDIFDMRTEQEGICLSQGRELSPTLMLVLNF